jgi:hypothetical protein
LRRKSASPTFGEMRELEPRAQADDQHDALRISSAVFAALPSRLLRRAISGWMCGRAGRRVEVGEQVLHGQQRMDFLGELNHRPGSSYWPPPSACGVRSGSRRRPGPRRWAR